MGWYVCILGTRVSKDKYSVDIVMGRIITPLFSTSFSFFCVYICIYSCTGCYSTYCPGIWVWVSWALALLLHIWNAKICSSMGQCVMCMTECIILTSAAELGRRNELITELYVVCFCVWLWLALVSLVCGADDACISCLCFERSLVTALYCYQKFIVSWILENWLMCGDRASSNWLDQRSQNHC